MAEDGKGRGREEAEQGNYYLGLLIVHREAVDVVTALSIPRRVWQRVEKGVVAKERSRGEKLHQTGLLFYDNLGSLANYRGDASTFLVIA
jgi:hypothetical protein